MTAPQVIRLRRVGSTQDVLHGFASDGAPSGTVVVAGEQTGGRGRRGRAWGAPPGGLWLSILYRPTSPAAAELVSLRVGLAVARALDGVAPVRLKWPNDLMLGDAKLGGILCEARWQGREPAWVAAGIGINVANELPAEARYGAARLVDAAPAVDAETVLTMILPPLRALALDRAALDADDLAELTARDWLRGRRLAAPLAGLAAGIDADGALLVVTGAGTTVPVRTGSVVLAEAAATAEHLTPEASCC